MLQELRNSPQLFMDGFALKHKNQIGLGTEIYSEV